MPILLLIVVVLALFALMLLLWPLALWNRYRVGTSRRQPLRWLTRLNAVLIPASALVFLGGMALAQLFVAHAFPYAALGVGAGLAIGAVGWALTRVEHQPGRVWYTPNRWLVLALTLVVVARVFAGIWQAWERWRGQYDVLAAWGPLGEPAGLFAVAGLVIGYHAAYAVLLQRRLGPWLR
ncbi:DUF1453 domain-containing protein [Luteimonas deserti]|uniref:DUF1453 domain-containing protein n=1 Tax=Luteimonas deserti TaxID=2752306 RepID=A0A7Z0QRJ4_9GAMM|nr:DUF1453 domain-containing protein [Luteimonas deserti]NYZ63534.1 DUF1453 domain-containing protein [Luteimonas deserti]